MASLCNSFGFISSFCSNSEGSSSSIWTILILVGVLVLLISYVIYRYFIREAKIEMKKKMYSEVSEAVSQYMDIS